MFERATFSDILGLRPSAEFKWLPGFRPGASTDSSAATAQFSEALKLAIAEKYVGKVVGTPAALCVAVAEVTDWGASRIVDGSGDGSMWTLTTFVVILFRPEVGERIRGRIAAQREDSMDVSLEFLEDVNVPASKLVPGTAFDTDTKTWYVELADEEGAGAALPPASDSNGAAPLSQPTAKRLHYQNGEEVIVAVESVAVETSARGEGQPGSVVKVQGSFAAGPALGPCSWYA